MLRWVKYGERWYAMGKRGFYCWEIDRDFEIDGRYPYYVRARPIGQNVIMIRGSHASTALQAEEWCERNESVP